MGGLQRPQTPSWHARPALPASVGNIKTFQIFCLFLVDMPDKVKKLPIVILKKWIISGMHHRITYMYINYNPLYSHIYIQNATIEQYNAQNS